MKTLNDYCQFLLMSPRLEDKLQPHPTDLVDITESAPIEIHAPMREHRIRMSEDKSKIPRPEHLNNETNRGLSFHHFANHELMAIELFAWAILQFQTADSKTRLGFLHTLTEEQLHLQLYLDRMKDYGVEFGSKPLNYVFWKQISKMKTLGSFSAIMSISFEGANLDFSLIYKRIFEYHNDEKGADILNKIYLDEIGHVRRGVKVLDRLRQSTVSPEQTSDSPTSPGSGDTHPTQWEFYLQNLTFPFTPRRAKGYLYFPRTRALAGLDEDFQKQLGDYSDEFSGKVHLESIDKYKIPEYYQELGARFN